MLTTIDEPVCREGAGYRFHCTVQMLTAGCLTTTDESLCREGVGC